jgi:hypothetical protein
VQGSEFKPQYHKRNNDKKRKKDRKKRINKAKARCRKILLLDPGQLPQYIAWLPVLHFC